MKLGLLRAWWHQRRAPTSATTPIASITVHEDGTVDRNAPPHPEVLARHREFLEADRARRES